jgi:hypothetical protein
VDPDRTDVRSGDPFDPGDACPFVVRGALRVFQDLLDAAEDSYPDADVRMPIEPREEVLAFGVSSELL